jgi:hypothetical protein
VAVKLATAFQKLLFSLPNTLKGVRQAFRSLSGVRQPFLGPDLAGRDEKCWPAGVELARMRVSKTTAKRLDLKELWHLVLENVSLLSVCRDCVKKPISKSSGKRGFLYTSIMPFV